MKETVTSDFRYPDTTKRTTIVGRTGSGKTVLGAHVLSVSPFDKQPYVMIDWKFDSLLNSIDRVEEIGLREIPKKPGLYIVHPMPDDYEGVDNWLWGAWKKENIGIYIDEGYQIKNTSPALRAVLTQGRSKHIPVIMLSQRPVFISKFTFSEADFFSVFNLNSDDDKKTIGDFMPRKAIPDRLDDYHSRWYDVGRDKLFELTPAPHPDKILERFNDRLTPKRRFW